MIEAETVTRLVSAWCEANWPRYEVYVKDLSSGDLQKVADILHLMRHSLLAERDKRKDDERYQPAGSPDPKDDDWYRRAENNFGFDDGY